MPFKTLIAAVFAVLTLLAANPAPAAAEANAFSGSLPANGFGIVVWGGGTVSSLATAARTQGCPFAAAWATHNGNFTGYVSGAPSIVNAAWTRLYPSSIPANTPLVVVCRSAVVEAPAPPPPPAPAPATTVSIDIDRQMSLVIIEGINRERVARGLPAFRESATLSRAAERYAPVVLANGALDHSLGGTEVWDRALAEGYPTGNVGEVLAARMFSGLSGPLNYMGEAPKFVPQWMGSPPHRAILMNEVMNFTEIGMGCAHTASAIYCAGIAGQP